MTKMMRTVGLVFAVAMAWMAMPGLAGAQPKSPPPYQAPADVRAQCDAELAKDATWRAQLEEEFIYEFHDQQSTVLLNNKRHVVMAYAAIWILTIGFVVITWLRQRRLTDEITRLRAEVDRATKDD